MKTVGAAAIPLHYGDPTAEHLAVRQTVGLVDRSNRGVWRIEGPDAAGFLQGLLSNDVEALQAGQGCYALILTDRGKIVSDVVVFRRKEDFVMHASAETSAAGFAMLDRFLVGDDATLSDLTGKTGVLGIYGPEAPSALASLRAEPVLGLPEWNFSEGHYQGETILISTASWTGEKGFELLVPAATLPTLWATLSDSVKELGGRPVGQVALAMLHVESGTPRAGIDFDENTLPQMANLDHAISYTKGCYRGQEIVLRVHTKGQVKHYLVGLTLEGTGAPLPGPGTKLLAGEEEQGWITSAIDSPTLGRQLALGYLHRTVKEPGTRVEIAMAPTRWARVAELPFYRRA